MKKTEGPRSTNYFDTFIEVAEDCPVTKAEIPKQKGEEKTIAFLQYEMMVHYPYRYTQDDVLFNIYAVRNDLDIKSKTERDRFFSKGQACLRSSPLGKRYGWGVHADEKGRVAIYPVESKEYKKLASDKKLLHLKGMRTSRLVKKKN